ncbi:MAG: TIGR00180 family glycosyltransferase [Gammaproteobacteria bacterium]|nr:TIGR00180 family glycosyltransferase [Gammaproteobacteria bacterium]
MIEKSMQNTSLTEGATIIIPTYNRPKELQRLLHFLKILNNPYPLVILDGSSDKNQALNKTIISKFDNIVYRSFPESLHLGKRLSIGLNESVFTKYSIFCPDDDFVIPDSIAKGVEYLDRNPEYSAVNGHVKCLAYPKKYGQLGLFAFSDHLKNPLILDQAAFLGRFLCMMAVADTGCPPLFYAVRRTEQTRRIFNLVPLNFRYSSQEMLSNALTLVWGKSITLPYLLMIRNYSSETTRDEIREDPVYGYTPEDAEYIRDILSKEIKRSNEVLSDELITYTLDHIIRLPLEKTSERNKAVDTRTILAKKWAFKKNWLFYVINYLFPSYNEKLDVTMNKKVVVALKKAFQAS